MPFRIIKVNNGYKILKLKTMKFAKPLFKTRQAAENQMKNWMRYAAEFTDKK